MPRYEVTAPTGKRFEINAPEGATEQQILAYAQQQFQSLPQEEPQSGFLRQVADVPLGVAKGAVSGARMITDIFGAGNVASEALKGVEESVAGLMSAQSRNDSREISRIMKEAEDKGFLDQVLAGVKAFGVAPIDMLSQAAGTAIPTIAGGIGARVLGAGVAGARAVGAGVGAGMGAGVTKGSIYEAVKEELNKTGMPADQIEARAQLAQSYGGENLDQILLGTALGGLAGTTGIEPTLAGIASKNVLTKAAAKSTAGRIGVGAVAEAAPEFAQASQEQLAQNLALQRQGFDVPLTRGIYGAGTLEALAGAGLGAGVSALTGRPEDAKVAPPNPGEPPKLIGYDPSSQEPMYVFPDGSVAVGEEAAFARRYAEQQPEAAPAEPPKLLGYSPTAGQEPLYVFSDGSVAVGEDAAFNRRYEPQKLSQEELSQVAPNLEGVEFKPVDQPPLPLTSEEIRREQERTELSERAERLSKVDRENSLLEFFTYRPKKDKEGKPIQVPDNRLDPSEVTDIASEKTKTGKIIPDKAFNFIRKKGGQKISTLINDQSLNEWLPFELRIYGTETAEELAEKEPAAEEYIKTALRNSDFLPYETKMELDIIGMTLDGIETEIQREIELDDLRDILAEIAAEEESARDIEQTLPEGTPTGAPEPTGQTRIERAAQREGLKPSLAYHSGDLGYGTDTTLGRMAGGRSTGHFGTGVYFVNNPEYFSELIGYESRPVKTVDLSGYNLLRPSIEYEAELLHNSLGKVNSLANRDNVALDSTEAQRDINRAAYNIYILDNRNHSESEISQAIVDAINEARKLLPKYAFTSDYIDSASTRVIKKLGYEGIDVRHLPKYDNTNYGTVVYAKKFKPKQTLSPEQREDRAIADRERELFALQPQTPERVGAPTGDLFGAEGAQQIQPATKVSRVPEGQLNLFNSDKDFVENSSSAVSGSPENIAEAQRVEKALKGKNPLQAAKWMAANATNPDYRLIAKRVADRMQKLMDAGVPFELHIVGVGAKVPRRLLNSNGITSSLIDEKNKQVNSVDIWLNNSTVTGKVGTNELTVLHELIHAVTSGATYLGNFKSMRGTEASTLFRRLHDVREVVVKHFNNRVMSMPADQLMPVEQKAFVGGANAFEDVDEILAWGLTDPDMQAYLESIPYKGKTAWNAFVDAIREFLGLPKAKETALSEVLAISDLLFESPLVEAGQAFPAAPVAPAPPIPNKQQIELFNARIAGMKPSEALKMLKPTKKAPEEKLTAEGERAKQILETLGSISNPKPKAADETLMKRLQGIFKPPAGLSRESWFRRMVVDKDAPVIEQLQTKYNNAVRDELDVVRPDLNLMQGQDVSNFADLMAQKGGIEIGADGLIHVYENKDASGKPITMDRVLELIAVDLGKKLGSADLAMQLAHNALIANRSNEILQNNKRIEVRADNAMSTGKRLMKSSDPAQQKLGRKMVSDANAMLKNVIEVRATQEEINAGLEAMRMYPEIQEAYDVFTAYKNNLVDFLQDSGRISKMTAENWKANAGYVPWTRVEEETNRFELDPRSFKNGVVNLSALPQLDKEGSSKEINNIFDNMVGLTYWAVRSGVNNFAAQRTLNTLPDVEVIEEDKVSDLRKKHPDRVVFSYKNGEREAYLLANPFQLATFSTIAPLKGGMFSALFAPAARFLRATITHMPAFAISQLVQDGTYRAALLSGVKQPYKLPAKVFKNFYKALRKQKEGALGELERLGVSGIYDGMPESTANRLRQRNKLEHRSAFKKAWDALEDFSLSADLAVRAAIYEQTMAETGDRALAYYRAKEYINFKRQGTDPIVYELRQSIPFFNAYLQGMDVLYRTMVGKGVSTGERKAAMKIFYMTGMQIAALNLLYTMMMSGDDDYEGLDDYVRNRNYILPGGFKIPVAPEVGFLFKVLPEQLYRTVMSDGVQTPQDTTAVAKRMTGAFVDAFGGMEYLPQLVKPLIELSTNYSFFLESPIVGAGLRNVDPKLQFTESTSELAKMLGGMANISPVKLDYFIRAYTGMAGTLGLEVTDSLMNPDRMGKPLYKTPQVSTFMYDPTGRGFKSDFYKFREEVDKVTDTVNMMKREGKAEELADYLTEEKATRYAMRGMVSRVEDQLSKLRNYRKIIASDTALSPAERREMTREILDQERELVKAYDIKELRKIAGF
jgi:hypothetical protein